MKRDPPKPVLMRCEGLMGSVISGNALDPTGMFLASFDPEAFGGRGDAQWTADPAKAQRFKNAAEAFATWGAVPACRPKREDGRPNKPLTAFSVSIAPIPEEPTA